MTVCVALLSGWMVGPCHGSPPPITREQLPRIEAQMRGEDAALQLQALADLAEIERGITKDLIPLLPRVLELCASNDQKVATTALYVVGLYARLAEARRPHGEAMIKVLADGLRSKHEEVRQMAVYSLHAKLLDERTDQALPILLSAVTDDNEQVRVTAAITLGKLAKPNDKAVAALRKALSDPAMQVRRQAALALANHAPASEAAIPQLLKALRDASGEVAGSATHALQQMGDAAVEGLLKAADDPKAAVRSRALHALATGYATGKLSDANGGRVYALIERMLTDPDAAVRAAAAVRIAYLGTLEARVTAVPILIKNATGKESLAGWNAFVGLHRCVRAFAAELVNKDKADVAFRGLQQFDRPYLKTFLRECQSKFKNLERDDLTPLFKAAADRGVKPAHRAFAGEVLGWVAEE